MWSQFTNVTDRRTDRQTTCDRNTALCTKVHRAVKTVSLRMPSVKLTDRPKYRWSKWLIGSLPLFGFVYVLCWLLLWWIKFPPSFCLSLSLGEVNEYDNSLSACWRVQMAYWWKTVRLQLAALWQKIQSIRRVTATRSYLHWRVEIRMCQLRQEIYSVRPSPKTQPHSPGGVTWRTQRH